MENFGQNLKEARENSELSFYQNPGYQFERRMRKTFIIKADPAQTGVFNVTLHEPLRIDSLSDIFLENFTTFHSTVDHPPATLPCTAYVLKFNEFNHQGNSTDSNSFNSLIIPNENTGAPTANSRKIHKGKKLNFVASINPTTLTKISGTITDLDGEIDTMFETTGDMFLAEFVIVSRD